RVLAVAAFIATTSQAAEDPPDRLPKTVQGISTVSVRVTERSRNSAAPAAVFIQRQLSTLLQKICGFTVVPDNGDAVVNVDFLTAPIEAPDNRTVMISLVRTSVWRDVFLLDPATRLPDKTKRMQMTGWLYTTVKYLQDDP